MKSRSLFFAVLAAVTVALLGYVPHVFGKGLAFSSLLAPASSAPQLARSILASQPSLTLPANPAQAVPAAPDVTPATCSTVPVVNCVSGDFTPQFPDLSIPGRGVSLAFIRSYSSARRNDTAGLGPGWTDNYDITLARDPKGVVRIAMGAATLTFRPAKGGGFTAPKGSYATLVVAGAGASAGTGTTNAAYTLTLARARLCYLFDAAGRLTAQTDLNGGGVHLQYAGSLLMAVTDDAGRRLTVGHTGTRTSSVTDPLGRVLTFSYDGGGNLVGVTSAAGRTWSYGYAAARGNRLTALTDPNGAVTSVTYDSTGRVTGITDPAGAVTGWQYSGSPATGVGATTVTDPDLNQAAYHYLGGFLMAATLGVGTQAAITTRYAYDPATLNVSAVTNPDGNVTTFGYDRQGNLKRVTEPGPGGQVTAYDYNALDEVTAQTIVPGEMSRFTYDASGNLLTATDPTGNQTTYRYDDSRPGDVTSVTTPAGQVTRYAYDTAGDVTAVTRTPRPGADETTQYAYDSDGELTCQASPAAATARAAGAAACAQGARGVTTVRYDNAGEVTDVTDPVGRTTRYRYDNAGDEMTSINAAGFVTSYAYDADGRLTAVTNPQDGIESTRYDPAGHVIAQTTPEGQTTSYTYDSLGQVLTEASPLGQQTIFGYDGEGDRNYIIAPSGEVTYYAYYPDGALKSIRYQGPGAPSARVSYTYYPDGTRKAMRDGTGTTQYRYDGAGRLTQLTNPDGTAVSYAYPHGQLAVITYPGDRVVRRSYDGAGQLTGLSDWLGDRIAFSYDGDGNLVGESFPGNVRQASAFDAADELTAITDTAGGQTIASLDYTRGSLGQVTGVLSSGLGQGPQSYAYTPAGQLAAVNGAQYGYDSDGNLTQLPGGTRLAYNAGGELTSVSRGNPPHGTASAGITDYGYDTNGSRTSVSTPASNEPAATLTYNQANELVSYTAAGLSARYVYNGDGVRTSKTVNATTTTFTWDESSSLPLLLTAGGTAYIDGPGGQPVEQVTGRTATFLLADQQGSIRLLTSASGKKVGSYNYNPYGTVLRHAGTVVTALQFDGEYTDGETGYLYLRARYYDPATAQFVSVDPEVSLTTQAYGYAGGNPLNAVDPTGLSWWNPFSWHRVWHVVATVAHVVATMAKVVAKVAPYVASAALLVAGCAATACLGDLAFLGIDAAAFYATLGSAATAVAEASATVGVGAAATVPVAQGVEIAANAMNTTGYCASDIGSSNCLYSASKLAGSVNSYTQYRLKGGGPAEPSAPPE